MATAANQPLKRPKRIAAILRWGTYPLGWVIIGGYFSAALVGSLDWNQAWMLSNTTLLVLLIGLETLLPMQKRWGATWSSFCTDLKYLVINGAFLGLVRGALGLFAISMAGGATGPASAWPPWLQLLACILIFEGAQYSIHRAMHIGSSPLNKFLWRLHSSHHLPQKLYITMHVVGHPLNGLLIQTTVMVIPIWWMGYSEMVCTAFLMLTSLHGLMAHFNLDIRMGWMNYVFVGTELHRHHHSSALKEAQNFGALTSLYDQLFGTFVYTPGVAPRELGAQRQDLYPDYQNLPQTLLFPFTGQASSRAIPPQPKG